MEKIDLKLSIGYTWVTKYFEPNDEYMVFTINVYCDGDYADWIATSSWNAKEEIPTALKTRLNLNNFSDEKKQLILQILNVTSEEKSYTVKWDEYDKDTFSYYVFDMMPFIKKQINDAAKHFFADWYPTDTQKQKIAEMLERIGINTKKMWKKSKRNR